MVYAQRSDEYEAVYKYFLESIKVVKPLNVKKLWKVVYSGGMMYTYFFMFTTMYK